jgi:hypothetical protein
MEAIETRRAEGVAALRTRSDLHGLSGPSNTYFDGQQVLQRPRNNQKSRTGQQQNKRLRDGTIPDCHNCWSKYHLWRQFPEPPRLAESAARQLQKSPGSAIWMIETICHPMDETLGEIQTTVDEEQSVPSIFMTNTRDLREGQNRAAALEESSNGENAKIIYEEHSR